MRPDMSRLADETLSLLVFLKCNTMLIVMMQHCHALDGTLKVELVVMLRWPNVGPEVRLRLDSGRVLLGLELDSNGLRLDKCWTHCKCGID